MLERFSYFLVYFLLFDPSPDKRPEHRISRFPDIRQVFSQIGAKCLEVLMFLVSFERFQKHFLIRAEFQDEINVEEILTFPKSVDVLLRENSRSRFSFFFCFFFSFSL